MHIAEVVTIAKSLPLLRLNTYKSLILSYSADYRRIFRKKQKPTCAFQILHENISLKWQNPVKKEMQKIISWRISIWKDSPGRIN